MPSLAVIVLDFDGTLTDVDAEASGYLDAYGKKLGAELGRDVGAEWRAALAYILEHADRHGWEHGGRIVAPAHADPYILAGCAARWLLDQAKELLDPAARTALLDGLYRTLYATLSPRFRPELGDFFLGLQKSGRPVYVVTNSQPDAVKKKLASAGLPFVPEVVGDAKKYVLDPPAAPSPRFDALPEHRRLSGLERPIYLRRGRYLEALEKVWALADAGPESTMVCGDIYEMDLAMPSALGATVHLVTRPGTRPWERGAVPDGGSPTLLDALKRL